MLEITYMKRHLGFTFIELVIIVAIAAILLTAGVPSFIALIKGNRMTTQVNEFIGTLSYARSEAVKRGQSVTICQSSNGTACGGALQWENGFLLFVDPNGNATVDAGEVTLRVGQAAPADFTIRGTNFTNALTYAPTAFIQPDGTSGFLTFCDDRGPSWARGVLVSATGRPRVSQDTNGNGVHEDNAGGELTCP